MHTIENDLRLREFVPRPMLTVPSTAVARPRFSVIDAHNHLGQLVASEEPSPWARRPVNELVEELDRAGVRLVVDLDGGSGEKLRREIARYVEPFPDRFIVFAGVDYDAFGRERDIGRYLARQLRESAQAGARGLKVWKLLGLRLRDEHGALYAVNDPRLDELWATAAELKLPVLIHIADPVAFFQPLDRFNERWEELGAHPDWHFYGGDFPAFDALMAQFADLIGRHRATSFIGAHVGCYAENLAWVGALMDRCPNFFVDIGARLAELGRQPYRAREFFIRHADRILFGADSPPAQAMYQLYYRFLETSDEYFNYDLNDPPSQGRWRIYGIDLPEEALRRIYYDNAARLLVVQQHETTRDK